MRAKRIFAAAIAGVVLSMSMSGAASASPAKSAEEYCSSTGGGLYFSPWGEAIVLWSPKVRELVKKFGAKWEAFKPVSRVLGPTGEDHGIKMPIGMEHDSIGLDGRICYPGGFSISVPGTGKQFKIDDGFAVRVLPCGITARPVINGVRSTKELQLATCFAPEVLLSVAGIKDGGLGGGVTPWHFNVSGTLAEVINGVLGEQVLQAGDPLFTLAPVLKFHPFRR